LSKRWGRLIFDNPWLVWANYLWLVWIISSLSFVRFYVYVMHALTHRHSMIAKPDKTRFGTPKIIFQVTTKGGIPIVQKTINQIHEVCKRIDYAKYEVWVVTDVEEEFRNCRTIIVPKEYSCDAVFKGRALQYAVELRSTEKKNTDSIYVFHLDDESLVDEQTVCSILTYLEDTPAPISEGLILYPLHEKEIVKISNLLDTIRPFCCFECMDFMKRGNPAYMHGSNLLVRSDVEEEVGWNNGKTFAEDSLFAIAARRKLGPGVFGWHGGVVEEKSPYNLRDIFRQRKRWFYGLIQNLRYLTLKDKILQVTRALIWSSGFISGLVSIFALSILQIIPVILRIFFLVASVLWLLSYQIGAFMNSKHLSRLKRFQFHLLTLISTPFIGMIECMIPILSVIRRPRTFEVVEK
jgi:egghead protein (zeste-white 4 protein)